MSAASIKDICELLASRADARAAVGAGKSLVPLLALLEHPLSAVDLSLRARLLEVGFSQPDAAAITTQRLALFALTNEVGTHWRERAISWFEEGLPIDEASITAFRAIEQDMISSQSLRHRARALRLRHGARDA